ncbi:hypothetical protein PF010_g27372 [Phytophthora fragariae]|uniref:Uncharacterized protein n=1 Tax=Phytophthora fragariae TaxID=53985 RepID=A0A6G0JU76_9STRA|nr:hypothetical protein PF010_g27372 [Phytophthora fragariae]
MWFELVDRNGEPLGPADKLHGPLGDVADFRRALKDSRSDSADLDGVEASLLKVYKDRKTYISRIALATNDPIARFGKQMETALIVEVPKVWFQLVDGGTRRPLEDAVCLPLANLRVEKLREAAKAKFSELFPKTVKASDLKVYESWEEYHKRTGGIPLLTDSSIENFGKSRETALIVEVPKVWFQLVDGGTRRAVTAWRRDDLLHYAKLTNWVVDTGLRMTTQLQPQTWPKLVKEQYFYNGGSLREFWVKWIEFDATTSLIATKKLIIVRVTIQKHKKFKPDRLKRLNEEIDKTPQLKGLRRVFVVVGPDSDIGNTFTLRDAPDQDAFLSCFDRDQLEPQHQEEQHPPPPSEE